MRLDGERTLLRLFLGESDRRDGMPLYEAIVQRARAEGLAGATVLRGIEGFGANSRIHRASIVRLSADLPIVVEIVDERDKIERFLALLDPWITDGLATLERVEVVLYRARSGEAGAG
jgi:PII-like signaling protein